MQVKLLAHSQISDDFINDLDFEIVRLLQQDKITNGQIVALTAIRTCYSGNEPETIMNKEGKKYFTQPASDGEGGYEADRLIRHILKSKHVSTMEHIYFTFTVSGVSRALMGQETRHRHKSFSIQSQRYVINESNSKNGGFDTVVPPTILSNWEALEIFVDAMKHAQEAYDKLIALKIPKEDARFVFPNAAATNMVVSFNLRTFLEYYPKRKRDEGAQWEIANLAEKFKDEIVNAESWLEPFFK